MPERGEHWEAAPRRPVRLRLVAALAVAVLGAGLWFVRGPDAGEGALSVEEAGLGEADPEAGLGEADPEAGLGEADPEAGLGEADPGAGRGEAGPRSGGAGWQPLAAPPLQARVDHVLGWTGRCAPERERQGCGELLVWGGTAEGAPLADGAAYDVAGAAWRRLPAAPRPGGAPGAWTGADPDRHLATDPGGELVIWGAGSGAHAPSGAAYDPRSDAWRALPEAPIEPRVRHNLTWNGSEVVVWGGRRPGEDEVLGDGAAYDPVTDAWRRLPAAPIDARAGHAATADPDGRIVVFGGFDDSGDALPDGAVYDPADDSWAVIEPPSVAIVSPRGGFEPGLAWHIPERAVYVVVPVRIRSRGDPLVLTYDEAAGSWATLEAGPVGLRSSARVAATADGRLVVWGGRTTHGGALTDGAILEPGADAWQHVPAPHLEDGVGAWVDGQLVVVGTDGSEASRLQALSYRPEP